MKAPNTAVLSLILALLLFGCTSQGPANQTVQTNQSPQAIAPQPVPPSAPADQTGWATYRNIGMSFDYPADMNITEEISGYPGYATVVAQGRNFSEGAVVVGFINASGISSLPGDPEQAAAGILKGDGENSDDISGQAQVRGEISSGLSANGVPMAERTFELTKTSSAGNSATAYGYALELYDPALKASYPVRIFSGNKEWTKQMRDRFVSSFRTGQ